MRLELTKRADYGIRAMLALARSPDPGALSVRVIAADHGIPARFLPSAMADLARAGLVESTTGRSGGYRLARPATDISLLDVVEAIDGDPRRRMCILRGSPCKVSGTCDVHDVFAAAQEALLQQLAAATLADVIAGVQQARRPADPPATVL
jgi:Rrf2 family protein